MDLQHGARLHQNGPQDHDGSINQQGNFHLQRKITTQAGKVDNIDWEAKGERRTDEAIAAIATFPANHKKSVDYESGQMLDLFSLEKEMSFYKAHLFNEAIHTRLAADERLKGLGQKKLEFALQIGKSFGKTILETFLGNKNIALVEAVNEAIIEAVKEATKFEVKNTLEKAVENVADGAGAGSRLMADDSRPLGTHPVPHLDVFEIYRILEISRIGLLRDIQGQSTAGLDKNQPLNHQSSASRSNPMLSDRQSKYETRKNKPQTNQYRGPFGSKDVTSRRTSTTRSRGSMKHKMSLTTREPNPPSQQQAGSSSEFPCTCLCLVKGGQLTTTLEWKECAITVFPTDGLFTLHTRTTQTLERFKLTEWTVYGPTSSEPRCFFGVKPKGLHVFGFKFESSTQAFECKRLVEAAIGTAIWKDENEAEESLTVFSGPRDENEHDPEEPCAPGNELEWRPPPIGLGSHSPQSDRSSVCDTDNALCIQELTETRAPIIDVAEGLSIQTNVAEAPSTDLHSECTDSGGHRSDSGHSIGGASGVSTGSSSTNSSNRPSTTGLSQYSNSLSNPALSQLLGDLRTVSSGRYPTADIENPGRSLGNLPEDLELHGPGHSGLFNNVANMQRSELELQGDRPATNEDHQATGDAFNAHPSPPSAADPTGEAIEIQEGSS